MGDHGGPEAPASKSGQAGVGGRLEEVSRALDPQASNRWETLYYKSGITRKSGYTSAISRLESKAFAPHRFTADGWSNEVDASTKDSKAILFQFQT